MIHKICLLSYGQQVPIAEKVLKNIHYTDVQIFLANCNVDSISSHITSAQEEHCSVFIASSGNAAEFKRCSDAPLIEIQMNTIDYLIAIKKAMHIGKMIAIAVYQYGRSIDISLLSQLTDAKLELILYEDTLELQMGISSSNADVIIGGAHACDIAEKLNHKYIYLSPSEEAVRDAIHRARTLAKNIYKRRVSQAITESIITNAPNGIIVTNEHGEITLLNKIASNQINVTPEMALSHQFTDILPNLSYNQFIQTNTSKTEARHLVNGAMLRCSHNRINVDGSFIGVLTTLRVDNRKPVGTALHTSSRPENLFEHILGDSPAILEAKNKARIISESNLPVIITGEPNTNRVSFARYIHMHSQSSNNPFILFDAASVSDNDMRECLYGRERQGLLETVQDGTIVFINLEFASPRFQAVLLQILKQGFYYKADYSATVPLQARFMTILSPGSAELINADLLTRLGILELHVPSLRERNDDIIPLFVKIFEQFDNKVHRSKLNMNVLQLLNHYSWPGNISELHSVCQKYSYLLSSASNLSLNAKKLMLIQAIGEEKLCNDILQRHPALLSTDFAACPQDELLKGVNELRECLHYNNSKIAKLLSISRTTLWRIQNMNKTKM